MGGIPVIHRLIHRLENGKKEVDLLAKRRYTVRTIREEGKATSSKMPGTLALDCRYRSPIHPRCLKVQYNETKKRGPSAPLSVVVA